MDVKMDAAALGAFLRSDFPQVGSAFVVEDVEPMALSVRFAPEEQHLRPGGTVSGPSMFALADVGVYLAVLSMLGPVALAVTTNCSIDFMRKPAAGVDLIAKVRLLKLGRLLAVGDVMMYSDGTDQPVARASLTYAIPPT